MCVCMYVMHVCMYDLSSLYLAVDFSICYN